MNLDEIIPTVKAILQSVDELSGVAMLSEDFTKKEMDDALKDSGLVLVIMLMEGQPEDPEDPSVQLRNLLVVDVLENKQTNTDNPAALTAVRHVLKALVGYEGDNPGLRNPFAVDKKAYTKGDLGTGLVTYFCNFVIKTIE